MIIRIALIQVFLLPAFLINAQVNFGVKAGPSLTSFNNGFQKSNLKLHVHGGGVVNIGIKKYLSIQTEILYSGKGGKIDSASNSVADVTINFSYLSAPVLICLHPSTNIEIYVGPEFSYLLKAKSKFKNGETYDITKNYESFDKGIAFGGAYIFKKDIGIYLRYTAGFKGIAEVFQLDNMGNIINKRKVGNHNLFQTGFYYNFSLRRT